MAGLNLQDEAMLKVAVMLMGVDGKITNDELSKFKLISSNIEGYESFDLDANIKESNSMADSGGNLPLINSYSKAVAGSVAVPVVGSMLTILNDIIMPIKQSQLAVNESNIQKSLNKIFEIIDGSGLHLYAKKFRLSLYYWLCIACADNDYSVNEMKIIEGVCKKYDFDMQTIEYFINSIAALKDIEVHAAACHQEDGSLQQIKDRSNYVVSGINQVINAN